MEIKCDGCCFVTRWKCVLKKHQLVHSDLKSWKCEVPSCGRSVKTEVNLKRHKRTHETNPLLWKPHRCKLSNCAYRAASNSDLMRHITTKHTPGRARNFQCSLCPKSFYTNKGLGSHIQAHVKELSLSCVHCNFRTHSKQSLYLHVKHRHGKAKTRYCTFPGCKYSTTYEGVLYDHV